MGKENRADVLKKNGITKEKIIADFVVNPENYTKKEQQTAFDLLAAETEEQVKCEFCHGGRKAKPIVNDSSEFLAFDKNGIVAFGNDGSVTTGEEYTRIKYCPMCGRYLD